MSNRTSNSRAALTTVASAGAKLRGGGDVPAPPRVDLCFQVTRRQAVALAWEACHAGDLTRDLAGPSAR